MNELIPWGALAAAAMSGTGKAMVEALRAGLGHVANPAIKIVNAHADAYVKQVEAKAEIDAQELWNRARVRAANDDARQQTNLERIVSDSPKFFGIAVDVPRIEQSPEAAVDWVYRFIDYARDVGEPDMQEVWSRILAGELEHPGSIPIRTMQVVSVMSRREAELLEIVASFAFRNKNGSYVIFTPAHDLNPFSDFIIDGLMIKGLASIGLMGETSVEVEFDEFSLGETETGEIKHPIWLGDLCLGVPKDYSARVFVFSETGNSLLKLISPPANPVFQEMVRNRAHKDWFCKFVEESQFPRGQ